MTFSTPGRALRRHRITQAGAISAGLMLALTACGGGAEAEQSPTSTASASSTDAATSAAATATSSTETAEEKQSSSAEASVDASSTEATGDTENTDASDAEAGGSNGIEFETTGTYVPASEKGPAQNVPRPIMPAAMKENTPEGAEAAVRYWWEAVYYLQQTNDADPLDEASTNDCNLCHAYKNVIDKLYDNGGWHTGSRPEVESILGQEVEAGRYLTTLITLNAGNSYESDGSIDLESKEEKKENQPWSTLATFDTAEGHWIISEVSYEEPRR
jgi:hypothetical protein